MHPKMGDSAIWRYQFDNGAFDDFDTFFKNVKELIADRDNYENF